MDIGVAWCDERQPWAVSGSSDAHAIGSAVGAFAYLALIKEVELTPKPGLFDRRNAGGPDGQGQ